MEAAKQLWADGQAALAVAEARAVLGDAQKIGDNAAAAARISCLLGTWLAETRCVTTSSAIHCVFSAHSKLSIIVTAA